MASSVGPALGRRVSSAVAGLALLAAFAPAAGAVECWRGWGYRVDPETQRYTSQEMLLVSRSAVEWRGGVAVELYVLDRASGRIDPNRAALEIVARDPRVRVRGRANYVDGRAAIAGSSEELAFGLSHVAEPSSGLEALEDHTRWACGLGGNG